MRVVLGALNLGDGNCTFNIAYSSKSNLEAGAWFMGGILFSGILGIYAYRTC